MKSLQDDPEFIALVERANREGKTANDILDEAKAIQQRHEEQQREETARETRERISKMSTSEKIAFGLLQSKPARGGVTYSDPAMNQKRAERDAQLLNSPGFGNASRNILKGLAESVPARGPTKPAA